MTRPARTGLLIAALALQLALAASRPVAAETPPVVLVVSLDGVRHDYPERGDFPGLERMAREGARATRLVPVFPSSTFANHVSLATGTHPDRHGIVDNEFWDRRRGERFSYSNDASWIEAEPLWCAAERQGVRAAVFFWVGSETDWRGVGASYRMAPFESGIGEAAKLAQLLAWLDLPSDERPQLVMSWWHGADSAGHRGGPDAPSVVEALAEQDRTLTGLLDALDARDAWPHTTLLVVSDHGMTTISEGLAPEPLLEQAGISARVEAHTAVTQVFLDDPSQRDDALRVLAGLEGADAYARDALPPRLRIAHPHRTGDLVVVARPPHFFHDASATERLQALARRVGGWKRGGHGFDPELPDMSAILFAMGRGVRPGASLGVVRGIDLAPTVSRLLGIEPPADSEGTLIDGIAPPAGAPAP